MDGSISIVKFGLEKTDLVYQDHWVGKPKVVRGYIVSRAFALSIAALYIGVAITAIGACGLPGVITTVTCPISLHALLLGCVAVVCVSVIVIGFLYWWPGLILIRGFGLPPHASGLWLLASGGLHFTRSGGLLLGRFIR